MSKIERAGFWDDLEEVYLGNYRYKSVGDSEMKKCATCKYYDPDWSDLSGNSTWPFTDLGCGMCRWHNVRTSEIFGCPQHKGEAMKLATREAF